MIYALNVFNLVKGKECIYRDYSVKAGKIIYALGGKVACSGFNPVRHLADDQVKRSHFIIVEFPSEEVFNHFYTQAQAANLHPLREESTTDYIWTLFQPWDLREWVAVSAS